MQKLVDYLMKFFIGLTFALAFLSIFRKDLFIAFIEWMGILIAGLGNWNYLVVFMSGMIESFPVIGVVIPGQNILLLSGGFFSGEGYLQLIMVILAASVGAIIGNYIGYILGVKYGKTFFEKYGLRLGIGETEVTYLEKGVKKWGALGIILGKFQPTTRAFLPFIAGSMGMKSNKFMIYNILGSFLRASTIVCIGLFFVKNYELIIKYMEFIFLAIFAAIGIYIYLYRKEEFKKYWKMKNDEIERKMNKSSVK